MRDATRGGLSAVLNEWADSSSVTIGDCGRRVSPYLMRLEVPVRCWGLSRMIWQMREPFYLQFQRRMSLKALNILREFNPNAEIIWSCNLWSIEVAVITQPSSWGTSARFSETFPTGGASHPRRETRFHKTYGQELKRDSVPRATSGNPNVGGGSKPGKNLKGPQGGRDKGPSQGTQIGALKRRGTPRKGSPQNPRKTAGNHPIFKPGETPSAGRGPKRARGNSPGGPLFGL